MAWFQHLHGIKVLGESTLLNKHGMDAAFPKIKTFGRALSRLRCRRLNCAGIGTNAHRGSRDGDMIVRMTHLRLAYRSGFRGTAATVKFSCDLKRIYQLVRGVEFTTC